ncbi:MAG: hypothetical protein KJN98_00145, partial [Pontiella sp.]|nr:hypothetical protein [Pontiella sp.]
KPSVFVEEDQQYITDWGSLENFRNESSFKVDCKKSILEKWREDSDVHQRGYTRMAYEILLENKSAQALSDLKVEYRVYYDKERNNNSTKKVDTIPSILPGSMEIQVVPPSQKISKTTHSIVLEKYSYNISDYYRVDGADPESTQDELRGIWIRLTLESDSGQRVVRDLCEPSSVRKKYTWSDAPATSNKKEKRRKKGNRR